MEEPAKPEWSIAITVTVKAKDRAEAERLAEQLRQAVQYRRGYVVGASCEPSEDIMCLKPGLDKRSDWLIEGDR